MKSSPHADRFRRYRQQTRAVRAGTVPGPEGEHSEPVFLSSSFVFDSAEQAAMRFSGEQPGNVYSRFTNPTVRCFEERLAAMEEGERGLATASGMSAILSICLGLLASGDHIVASRSVFGTTVVLLDTFLTRWGIHTTWVAPDDYAAWQAACTPDTRVLFLETPTNPLTRVVDIARLADLAHRQDCLLVVDNCFCTPILQKPLALGADLVIHSATKYLDGQGRCIGGAVVGPASLIDERLYPFLRTAGPCMSPVNAWVFLKGLETLSCRMQAHCAQAQGLAEWLDAQTNVEQVYYPGLPHHPEHALAKRQQSGFGGVLSFVVPGGQDAAWRVINATRLFSITANLGDTRSTITHPATTTHRRLSEAQRQTAGIVPGLIRLSAGLEDLEDLTEDLARGLGARHAGCLEPGQCRG